MATAIDLPERTEELPAELIPRCDLLDGSSLAIVPAYTEAGYFCEANVLTVTDGVRTALYVPLRVVDTFAVGDRVRCHVPGSWADGRTLTVTALNVMSSDGIRGHALQTDAGYTVIPAYELEKVATEPIITPAG